MSKLDKNLLYMSYDADSAGRKIGKAVLNDDPEEMSRVSESISLGNKLFERWAKEHDWKQYSSGGDQGVYSIPKDHVGDLERLRVDYHYVTGLTVSIGVGEHLSESGQALLMAKLKGKNQIVFFGKETKKEIQQIKKRAKKGQYKSIEEHKIAESYLDKSESNIMNKSEQDCQYCAQSDGTDLDHCKYCHDAEDVSGEGQCPYCVETSVSNESDCQYCKEKDEQSQHDCPYCKEAPEALTSPDSNNEQAPAGSDAEKNQYDKMGMNPPIIGKPTLEDHAPIGQNAPMDAGSVEPELTDSRNVEAAAPTIDPDDNHSKGALTAIAEQIESEGNPTASAADSIEETNIVGTETEGNISRPEGFAQNTPQDMGTGGPNPPTDDQSDPDLSDILEEGLDHSADSIQREKAIQVVSQALTQFKGCKDVLENIKGQAPQLYQASISMLRAMIEMASLLGLGQNEPGLGQQSGQNSVLGQEQASLTPQAAQENEWHDPFPAHPDHGGEAKPGHSPSSASKEDAGAIGTPIGKLSGKHTTEHVARTTTPPGAINANGQQKVIDPKTGETRWIDRKQGMVQSATGVPIKPPKRGSDVPQN